MGSISAAFSSLFGGGRLKGPGKSKEPEKAPTAKEILKEKHKSLLEEQGTLVERNISALAQSSIIKNTSDTLKDMKF